VDQRGGLERVVAAFPPELSMRHRAQLVVEERDQPLEGAAIAAVGGVEERGGVRAGEIEAHGGFTSGCPEDNGASPANEFSAGTARSPPSRTSTARNFLDCLPSPVVGEGPGRGALAAADGRQSSAYHRDDGPLSVGIVYGRVSGGKRSSAPHLVFGVGEVAARCTPGAASPQEWMRTHL
jgi:hypothetical protein